MTWNHRVIEFADPATEQGWFEIHEVFYDDHGNPKGYGENGAPAHGDSVEEVSQCLDRMREALSKPVLRERDFHRAAVETTPVQKCQHGKPLDDGYECLKCWHEPK